MRRIMVLLVTGGVILAAIFACMFVGVRTAAAAKPPEVQREIMDAKRYEISRLHLGNNAVGDDIERCDVFVAKDGDGRYVVTTTRQWLVSDMPETGAAEAVREAQMAYLSVGAYEAAKRGGHAAWRIVKSSENMVTASIWLVNYDGVEMRLTQKTWRADNLAPGEIVTDVQGDAPEWITAYYDDESGEQITSDVIEKFYDEAVLE